MESPLGQKGARGCSRIGNITARISMVWLLFRSYIYDQVYIYIYYNISGDGRGHR